MAKQDSVTTGSVERVSFAEAVWTWCRVALLSFGGPAGQMAVMHRIVVDEKKWISEERFLHALNYCMLLPGPEAQQLATYIGWLMHRTKGGLAAGLLFILPGFVAILGLSILYACYQDTSVVQALFFGLKPAVMAIVLEAVIRIGKRVLKNGTMIFLAAASFVAIFFFDVPFPALIAVAAVVGSVGVRFAADRFDVNQKPAATDGKPEDDGNRFESQLTIVQPSVTRSLLISVVCLTVWFAPLVGVAWLLGPESTIAKEGVFFSQAAVVTFGGAYSVLAYIAQQAVEKFGWLQPGEMLDGLGMAETTPGPLIMVVQFVGFMGAYRNPGTLDPLMAGILGSLVTTWATFAPCFYWIFLGAPYIERLRGNRTVRTALTAITAAVVGVILNLAVWFSLHTLFGTVTTQEYSGIRVLVPEWSTISWPGLAIAAFACVLTFYWKRGMAFTLAVCCILGAAVFAVQA
ncbi:MAG: chromate efflux transporter [Fuerstiella sp.]